MRTIAPTPINIYSKSSSICNPTTFKEN